MMHGKARPYQTDIELNQIIDTVIYRIIKMFLKLNQNVVEFEKKKTQNLKENSPKIIQKIRTHSNLYYAFWFRCDSIKEPMRSCLRACVCMCVCVCVCVYAYRQQNGDMNKGIPITSSRLQWEQYITSVRTIGRVIVRVRVQG